MAIRIESQAAQLTWDTQKAQLNQSGNGIQTLDIQIRKPQIEINTTRPQLSIDQTQPFAEAGLKNLQAFMSDSVSYARQIVSQGIDRIVSQGNEMKEIHTGVDPIPDQAISTAKKVAMVAVVTLRRFARKISREKRVFAMVPQSRPQIDVTSGDVDIQFNPGEVANNSAPRRVQMDYTPWQINYYMKQYASIRFSYEPPTINTTV